MQKRTPSHLLITFSGFIALALVLSACLPFELPGVTTPEEKNAAPEAEENVVNQSEFAEVIFQVEVPESQTKTALYLDILDETTGIALHPTRYTMEEQNSTTYISKIPLRIGSVIKYRYRKEGNPPAVEVNNLNQIVRYRQYIVAGPAATMDQVTSWSDAPNAAIMPFGRIEGVVKDAQTGAPVGNMVITAAGQQTLSAPDGTFLFEGVQPGTHLLVAQHANGEYASFQQGAKVEIDAITPAELSVEARKKVNVTFVTSIPTGGISGLPVRIIGSTFNLGNSFSDLQGGMSAIAARAPLMQVQEDGRYQITLQLPAGAYIEYKYTLGDGYWNAEQSTSGSTFIRFLTVPNQDTTVEDTIAAWGAADGSSVTFKVTAPEFTPATDTVSIQFDAFGWSAPIPMWPLGNNQWVYILHGPEQMLQYLRQYRYCRNDQCETGVEADPAGAIINGRNMPPLPIESPIQDTIANWNAYFTTDTVTTVPEIEIKSRPSGFITGFELTNHYSPFTQSYYGPALKAIKDTNANWVVLSPTRLLAQEGYPIFKSIPGQQITSLELSQIAGWVEAKQLGVALFPQIEFTEEADSFWSQEGKDGIWWNIAFERYDKYLLAQADLARMIGAKELIIGDPAISPMMPGGTLPDGSTPQIPFDVNQWWNNLAIELRGRFEGRIFLAIDPNSSVKPSNELIGSIDGIYMIYAPSLSAEDLQSSSSIELINTDLEEKLMSYYVEGKPFVIAYDYPANDSMQTSTTQTLEQQVLAYNAFLSVLNSKDWVSGMVSRGFDPSLMTKYDNSSVYGKPAANALWYWFPRLLGLQ